MNTFDPSEVGSVRVPSNRTRVVLLLAVAAVGGFAAVLVFAPRLPERVTVGNYNSIRLGMSQAELHDLLGPPHLQLVERGFVEGPGTYVVNFAKSLDQEQGRDFREYVRQIWSSPETGIVVVLDSEGAVVCHYPSSAERRSWAGLLPQ